MLVEAGIGRFGCPSISVAPVSVRGICVSGTCGGSGACFDGARVGGACLSGPRLDVALVSGARIGGPGAIGDSTHGPHYRIAPGGPRQNADAAQAAPGQTSALAVGIVVIGLLWTGVIAASGVQMIGRTMPERGVM
jgi:hypothetical protein